tara:strand:+ start:494 stop:790 length:297 start_codon:yes stop_codon:yes gene_type:complete
MDATQRLREYIIKEYGEIEEPMSTPIIKLTKNELNHSKCEMCQAPLYSKKSFVWEPMMKNLIPNSKNLTICESCAKREHGSKNKYKWKQLMEDLNGKL